MLYKIISKLISSSLIVLLYIVKSAKFLQEADGTAVVVDHDGGGDDHDGHAGEQETGPLPSLLNTVLILLLEAINQELISVL
mgnify:CR=1 FL=1